VRYPVEGGDPDHLPHLRQGHIRRAEREEFGERLGPGAVHRALQLLEGVPFDGFEPGVRWNFVETGHGKRAHGGHRIAAGGDGILRLRLAHQVPGKEDVVPVAPIPYPVEIGVAETVPEQTVNVIPQSVASATAKICFEIRNQFPSKCLPVVALHPVIARQFEYIAADRLLQRVHETGFVGENSPDRRAEVISEMPEIDFVSQPEKTIGRLRIQQVGEDGDFDRAPEIFPGRGGGMFRAAEVALDERNQLFRGEIGIFPDHLPPAVAARPVVFIVEPGFHVVFGAVFDDVAADLEPLGPHVLDLQPAARIDQELFDSGFAVRLEIGAEFFAPRLAGDGTHRNQGVLSVVHGDPPN